MLCAREAASRLFKKGIAACSTVLARRWRRIGNKLLSTALVVRESLAIHEHDDVCAAHITFCLERGVRNCHPPPEGYFLILAKNRFDDEV